MNNRITSALCADGSNNILPFLWAITGVDAQKTIDLMHTIKDCGINAVCVESRTFEDYAGDTWWPFIERILTEARALDMKVWILDDVHFPTGFAAGRVADFPEKRRLQLAEFHIDVIGPRRVDIRLKPYSDEDELLGAVAVKRSGIDEELLPEYIVIDAKTGDDFCAFDAPEGVWRVFEMWLTHKGTTTPKPCVNMIDDESVQILVDAVYEGHYKNVGEYFGKELAGFFSDEPCLGNDFIMRRYSAKNHHKSVGMPGLALPWSDALKKSLTEKCGDELLSKLPLIWYDGEGASEMRIAYMDAVSALYAKCFSGKLGAWCEDHGVEYIGHIIEDSGSHCRLSGSTGHYFRGVEGQHMSGIDVVLNQMLPGFIHTDHTASFSLGRSDPKFYNFMLAKLGSSLAHIRTHMKNRAMCEVFGAYGWGMEASMMKWLIDHFLVNGINYYVPHAFSPIFPNSDCPPHFYADGINPQFEDLKLLMRYLGKMTALLEGNRVLDTAILYHAEMEWSGKPFMKNEVIIERLTESQIDSDIVPSDDLYTAKVENGVWKDGNASFRMLIVPEAEFLPQPIIDQLNRLNAEGLDVVQVNRLTEGLTANAVPLEKLSEYAHRAGIRRIHTSNPEIYLRVIEIEASDAKVFMLFNTSVTREIETCVTLPDKGCFTRLDVMGGHASGGYTEDGGVAVRLTPYESVVFVFDGTETKGTRDAAPAKKRESKLLWQIAAADCETPAGFTVLSENAPLRTIEKDQKNFSGIVRYTSRVTDAREISQIEIDNFNDTAEIRINGKSAGRRLCAPYRFDTADLWREGENALEILAYTTLGRRERDIHSAFMPMNLPGIVGPVYFISK